MPGPVLPVLYSFRRCPYAIRARVALHVASVAVEIREVALRDKPEALRRISAKATVPVLQLPDGQVLDESLDILVWALQQHDPHDWLARWQDPDMQHWVRRNDNEFKPMLDRYKYARRDGHPSQQSQRDAAVQRFIGPLDTMLARQGFLCGRGPGWADLAVFPFVRQFAMVEPEWFVSSAWPHVRHWLKGWLASAWFTSVMVKHPVWAGEAPAALRSAQLVV